MRGARSVQFEVPWREATAVRTAKRSELLLMLAEALSLPEVDVRWFARGRGRP